VSNPPAPTVAVGAVVIDRTPEGTAVLLVRRARPPHEGRWSLPGGRVEPGVKEETGLSVRVGSLIEVIEVIDPLFHYVILDYACERAGGQLRPGDDAERVEMVAIGALGRYALTPGLQPVISKALGLKSDPRPGT
jgi:8-oxo-dGTP diphosphatase